MKDIYDHTHAHKLALDLGAVMGGRYFDRLTIAATLLCDIQDGIAHIATDLAAGVELRAPMAADVELSGYEMVQAIVFETLSGSVYEGRGDWFPDRGPVWRQQLGRVEPDAFLVAELTSAGEVVARQLAGEAIKRLVAAYAPEKETESWAS